MNKPQDEFSIVPLESDDEIFEVEGVDDVTALATWAPAAVDKGILISDQFEALGEMLKKRGKELVAAGQSRINWAKNFRQALRGQMNLDGSTEILGIDWRVCVQKSKPKLIIENEDDVPDAYKRAVTTYVIDKEALRQDLELGVPVAGARLESDGALRIRPNVKRVAS